MNPRRLRLRNFRSFAELDLDLPDGCVAITGANGAGKSSFVSAIDVALFGPEGRSWAPYLTEGVEETEMMVELTFEHAGEVYRVRRGYSSRGAGKTTLDLETLRTDHDPGDRDQWEPLTRESQSATQDVLERILGLRRATFRASSMLAQGDGAALTEATPAERKRIIAAALGLDRFDRYLDAVKAERKTAQAQIDRLDGSLARADEELAGKAVVEDQLAEALAERDRIAAVGAALRRELEEVAQTLAAQDRIRAARAEALAAATEVAGRLGPLEQRLQQAEEAAEALQVAEDELGALTTLDQAAEIARQVAEAEHALEGHRHAVRRRQELEETARTRTLQRASILGQASDFKEKAHAKREQARELAEHAGHDATCDRCGQTLGAEARASAIASLRHEADELDAAARDLDAQANEIEIPAVPPEPEPPLELEQQLAVAQEAQARARQDELQRERLSGRVQVLRERIANAPAAEEMDAARAAVQAARARFDELDAGLSDDDYAGAQARAAILHAGIEAKRGELERAAERAAAHNATLERLRQVEESTVEERAERERLHRQIDLLAVLERAYGRDGIPALIIANVLPTIETEAGRILEELGTSYRIELRTARALASGAVADALDVIVCTDRGERPYETFSGGERTRINVALAIAFAELLSARRGAESRLLALDEPEFLDEQGTHALANVLQGLNGAFDKVWLISHVPELRSAFDQTLEVVNDDGSSRVIA